MKKKSIGEVCNICSAVITHGAPPPGVPVEIYLHPFKRNAICQQMCCGFNQRFNMLRSAVVMCLVSPGILHSYGTMWSGVDETNAFPRPVVLWQWKDQDRGSQDWAWTVKYKTLTIWIGWSYFHTQLYGSMERWAMLNRESVTSLVLALCGQ